jgi:hypothetical protein
MKWINGYKHRLPHLLNSVNNLNFLNFLHHHQVLTLTASANKLSKILERVDEYTALIMEELDPDNLGYIEVHTLALLALSILHQLDIDL